MFKILLFRNLPVSKVLMLNFVLFSQLGWKKAYSRSKDYDYLLDFDKEKFGKKKCPKIIFINNEKENSTYNQLDVKSFFEKMFARYSELESYIIDFKKDKLDELRQLFLENGYSVSADNGEFVKQIKEKPFILMNKYGDVQNYSVKEFGEISKSENLSTFFEKLTILNDKNDLLLLNDYDYVFMIYLKDGNVDYKETIFKIFRKIYFNVFFFNVKFFVATKEHSKFLDEYGLSENNIYIVRREKPDSNKIFKLNNENFEFFNLTQDLKLIDSKNENKFLSNLINNLTQKYNFTYYSNSAFSEKQAIEVLNIYFKDVPYYVLFTDLKYDENKTKLNGILEVFKRAIANKTLSDNYFFVIMDNSKVLISLNIE